MVRVKRLVLDILKPHHPNGLEFAKAIASQGSDYRVYFRVEEVDEKTETVTVVVEGDDIQFEAVSRVIESIGGSLHSVDEVDVLSETDGESA